ncbi:hypothetical protein FB451DRAFT_1411567 [Mycena latifolia]|nr:hypothetical protein FB451DRAFT_1411567 [Mycena latifolia]
MVPSPSSALRVVMVIQMHGSPGGQLQRNDSFARTASSVAAQYSVPVSDSDCCYPISTPRTPGLRELTDAPCPRYSFTRDLERASESMWYARGRSDDHWRMPIFATYTLSSRLYQRLIADAIVSAFGRSLVVNMDDIGARRVQSRWFESCEGSPSLNATLSVSRGLGNA